MDDPMAEVRNAKYCDTRLKNPTIFGEGASIASRLPISLLRQATCRLGSGSWLTARTD